MYRFITAKDYIGDTYSVSELQYDATLFECFTIKITIYANDLNSKALIGQPMSISCMTDDEDGIFFHGYVFTVSQQAWGKDELESSYQLTLVPWLKLLDISNGFTVYQERSAKDIITSIFEAAGFKDAYTLKGLPNNHIDCCIQYDESLLSFIERLLSEINFVYYFEHNIEGHELIIQSANSQFNYSKIQYFDYVAARGGENPLIDAWSYQVQFHANSTASLSYLEKKEFLEQKTTNHAIANSNQSQQVKQHFTTGDDQLAKETEKQLSAIEQDYETYSFSSAEDEFDVGKCFTLVRHTQEEQQRDYLTIAITKSYQAGSSGGFSSTVKGKAIPRNIQFNPKTINPQIAHGVLKAIVMGEKGEIVQDEKGRVKVKFYWQDQKATDQCSAYISVLQSAQGQFTPRAGEDVLVSFINGNLKFPVIMGSVFSDQNPCFFSEGSQSGIITKREGNSNSLCFDDKKDEENLTLSAAKTLELNATEDANLTIGGIFNTKVTGNSLTKIEGLSELICESDITAKGNAINITGKDKITLTVGSSSIAISSSSIELTANNIEIKATNNLSLSSNNYDNKANIKHTTSASTLEITSNGPATFKGLVVDIEAQTSFSAQGMISAELKSGLMASVSSDAVCEVKGLIVMVN